MSLIYEGPTLVPEPDYVFDLNTPWAQRDFAEPERKRPELERGRYYHYPVAVANILSVPGDSVDLGVEFMGDNLAWLDVKIPERGK